MGKTPDLQFLSGNAPCVKQYMWLYRQIQCRIRKFSGENGKITS